MADRNQQKPSPDLRIGIVGAGCAGLTAAEELRKKGYDNIWIFESKRRVGGKAMTLPLTDTKTGQKTGLYEGGTVFVLPGKLYDEYARNYKLTLAYDAIPRAQTIDIQTGSVTNPFLVKSPLPLRSRAAQLVRFLLELRRHGRLDQPGFHAPLFRRYAESASNWFTHSALDFAREVTVPLANALQFPSLGGQIPAAYYLKTAALLQRLGLLRLLSLRFPKFAEGNQTLWDRVAANHRVILHAKVTRVTRPAPGSHGARGGGIERGCIEIEAGRRTYALDRLIWTAPLDEFLSVSDPEPDELDLFSRIRTARRAVVTCRIDGLPPKVCYFIKNTVDHGIPMGYPYAIYEVKPGSRVYNLYPYLYEDTTDDELVRNVYDLARRLGGTRARLLTPPLRWKWFPYFSVEQVKRRRSDGVSPDARVPERAPNDSFLPVAA